MFGEAKPEGPKVVALVTPDQPRKFSDTKEFLRDHPELQPLCGVFADQLFDVLGTTFHRLSNEGHAKIRLAGVSIEVDSSEQKRHLALIQIVSDKGAISLKMRRLLLKGGRVVWEEIHEVAGGGSGI